MSEQKPVSPLLDGFVVGNPMSTHNGIRCCPAIKENSNEKYIVKIISVPASQVQLDAFLLTGAYKDPAEAMDYFREVADGIVKEAELINTLSKLEGFLPYDSWQIVPMEDGKLGYEVYLLSTYKRSLQKYMQKHPITHLEAVNLGLDLCTALAISRRAGHLYVDLKPANIFLSKGKEFRIGDLGFISLDSLAYTSLPEKYRSPYSTPEGHNDLKTLNTTADTYAVGMILYQIYNDGSLPEAPLEPTDPFPCPANADYEISAIIMKAVDPDPAKRWTSPMEMGQALVRYMQRNSVNNVPITPPASVLVTGDDVLVSNNLAISETSAPATPPSKERIFSVSAEPEAEESLKEESAAPEISDTEPALPESTPEVDAEEFEPLSEQTDAPVDEAAQSAAPEMAADFPESAEEEFDDLDFSIAFQDTPHEEPKAKKPVEKPQQQQVNELLKKQKSRKQRKNIRQLFSILSVLLVLILIACGAFWFYKTQYLKTIDDLTISGTQNQLTVTVKTDMDESLLQVTCTDAYGNHTSQAVVNGQSTFTDLLPDSLYRIELTVDGFHALEGKTAEIFTTDALTNITTMSAVTGPEDGSVMLNFTVDGPEPAEWIVTCSTEGEADITQTFTGHTVTVRELTVGKQYNIQLGASGGAQLLGETSVTFQATALILAQNLTIVSCEDGIMTVRWDAPEGVSVDRWGVRCYNDQGHEEVLEIGGTEFAFTGIDTSIAYTVEVMASGMTESARITMSANPLTITDLTVNADNTGKLILDWEYKGTAPEGGWLLLYSLDGSLDQQSVVKCTEPHAVIENRIPGAQYRFQIQAVDSSSVFNDIHTFTSPNATVFSYEGMNANNITSLLLKTPAEEGWTHETVAKDVFTDTFQSGDSISIVLKSSDSFHLPTTSISVLYVIRNSDGKVLSDHISREEVVWKDLWYDDEYRNCELDIPSVPKESGSYTISIYFNNQAVTSTGFTIS